MTFVFIKEAYYRIGVARIEMFKSEAEADKYINSNRQEGRKIWKG